MANKGTRKRVDKTVATFTHDEASRRNIPTAEYQAVMEEDDRSPIQIAYERRNRDLDPQLVWRGKDEQNGSDLVVQAPPLFIQEKVHPKVLIDDLVRQSRDIAKAADASGFQADLFADFNGLPNDEARTEFYQHDAHWSNRMILGDSLQVMASLAEREGLRGKVQCIYFDPPYGIRFNSNFQWSTTSRDVKDGKAAHITREPEQVKAFRDTWRDGIHSYLTYLRDRLTVARDLLTDSGSIFVQIGDENVSRVRLLMDEVFGESNFVALIAYATTTGFSSTHLSQVCDYLIWYSKILPSLKYRSLFDIKKQGSVGASKYRVASSIRALASSCVDPTRLATSADLTSQGASDSEQLFHFRGAKWTPPAGLHWKTTVSGLDRLAKAQRIIQEGRSIRYVRFLDDFSVYPRTNVWLDVGGVQSRTDPKVYVVQTATEAVKRCVLMCTDPGDLILDPTCGSGTTAYVAEQWGRRWITIDTSRVALALARARIMGARYPYYLLSDSRDGQLKEAPRARARCSPIRPFTNDVRQGFVYERVPHITLRDIANNAEIDVIWERFQEVLNPLRRQLNDALCTTWEEWEIPHDAGAHWPEKIRRLHSDWWEQRIARQKEIDASIAARTDYEYLYDKPYEDNRKVRVAGPFTVESLSPHRVLGVDENDELIDPIAEAKPDFREKRDFAETILEHLNTSGIQQVHKEDRISFSSIFPWPGDLVCAEGSYVESDSASGIDKRAAIFIGPEFGTVSRPDLLRAAREAADADFDVLIACAFNYEAHATDFDKLGRVPILKARMNADLHMSDDLKNTGKGNLFVIFGEPDIDILEADDGQIQVQVKGVDVFHPNTGEIRSDSTEGIARWFIDTDYNGREFFVRHAYFLGENDPYNALKTTPKA